MWEADISCPLGKKWCLVQHSYTVNCEISHEGRTHILEILCDCLEGSQGHLQSLYSYIYRLNPQSITYIWVDQYLSRWSDFQGRECIFLNTHVFEDVILCHLLNTNRCFGGKSACILLDPEDGGKLYFRISLWHKTVTYKPSIVTHFTALTFLNI